MSSETTGATGLSGRYASALFKLAEADKALDQTAEDLARLAKMIEESDDLARLLRSPVTARADQARAVSALLEKSEMSDLVRRFVGVVSENRRLAVLPDLIKAYQVLMARHRGEETAEVVSAKELTAAQLKSLGASLKKAVGTTVTIEPKVDPEILGGLVVKVGSRMVDSSLRTKLQQLRLAMKGVG